MKFAYKFNNLLGAVYRKGDLVFTPDGNSVISPVGNRISVFDLNSKDNKVTTLPVESKFNYTTLDLSPNGCTLIAINEEGDADLISLVSQTVIHKYRFKRKVRAVKFSPNGEHFAVCKENKVFVFKTPGPYIGGYNGFVMERVFHGAYDETTCIDWSYDSKILAVGAKDATVKLYPINKWKNFRIYSLGNHTDNIVSCFFEQDSYDVITVSKNGQTCVWECTIEPEDLIPLSDDPPKKKKRKSSESEEDDVDVTKSLERTEEEVIAALNDVSVDDSAENNEVKKFFYKRIARHYLADEAKKTDDKAVLTAATYHKKTKILVTGYSTGAFFIHELPEVNLIHSLSISDKKITSISFNCTGDWIAIGCSSLGQLLVWEWQSEKNVLSQQSHANNISSVTYSADGQYLATGGEDGKVKLWSVQSGFCFVTFHENTSAVTAVAFSANKKFFLSSSLDGTVRAFDILRYRNFRTFTAPRLVQFGCVAADSSGEFVASGGQDVFEIFLWSVKTGKLLEVLSGHEAPVVSLAFSPNISSTVMVSTSWDKTVRIWDAIEKNSEHETIELYSDGLYVAFNPTGQEVAVATLDGQISIFDVKTAVQIKSIEGRNDLGSGRSDTDLITAKKTLQAKAFTSLCYSADGEYLLAGGQSKNVCIYYVKEALIVKRFEITQNRSFDAVDDFINRRKMTEFGNKSLVEERDDREGGNIQLKLPGVKSGDMSGRSFKPEVRVFSLQFSPTGQQWAAATSEGLLIYSLNTGLVFDPWDLSIEITPAAVRKAIVEHDHTNALVMAIKLNEPKLIQEVIEQAPVNDIELIISNFGEQYVQRLLVIMASTLDTSRHVEYYLHWVQTILNIHGPKIRPMKNMPTLLALEKGLIRKYEQLSKICDYNKYTMQYIGTLGEAISKKSKEQDMIINEVASDNESDVEFDVQE